MLLLCNNKMHVVKQRDIGRPIHAICIQPVSLVILYTNMECFMDLFIEMGNNVDLSYVFSYISSHFLPLPSIGL